MALYYILTVLLIAGILLLRNRNIVSLFTVLFLIVQISLNIFAALEINTLQLEYFTFDSLGLIFLSILTVLSVTTVFHGFKNLKTDSTRRYQYYHASLTGLIASLSGALLASNVTLVWVFVEATTLTASVLIYHEKNKLTLEAAWKYVFVCSVGIALAYMGILFLGLALSGNAGFDMSFKGISGIISSSDPIYLKVAFLFILVGYGTKMELFPMHTAGVDANSVAHPQIGAFISTAMVNLGFVAFFRIYKILYQTNIQSWMSNVLLLTGILSILVAAGYMLKARHTKRMLAYSTLEIMGIVAIALGIGGIGFYAAILILIVHSLVKSALFYQLSQMFRIYHTYMIKEVGHYFRLNPAGSLVLIVGMVSILAIPPSGLFWPEFLVFSALASGGYWLVLLLIFFLLCFVVYAMSTRMMHILFSAPVNDPPEIKKVKADSSEISIQMLLLIAAMALCFYQPGFLKVLIQNSIHIPL
ncbi:MAG: proton-conducting transporter membrane subunit [Bacteroidales bacterium]